MASVTAFEKHGDGVVLFNSACIQTSKRSGIDVCTMDFVAGDIALTVHFESVESLKAFCEKHNVGIKDLRNDSAE